MSVAQDEVADTDLDAARLLLRRMADALESIAVFDRLYGEGPPAETGDACAFVAAESLALLAASSPPSQNVLTADPLLQEANYVSVESALLYMIGGYDSNAAAIVGGIEFDGGSVGYLNPVYDARQANAIYVLDRLISLCQSKVRQPRKHNIVHLTGIKLPGDYDTLTSDIRSRLYEKLGLALDSYLDWSGGYEDHGLGVAVSTLQSLCEASTASGYVGYSNFADIYHLSRLLLYAIERISKRSMIQSVPAPIDGHPSLLEKFTEYVQHRARGDDYHVGFPFLWPSALQYVRECLPGPSKDAVLSMPTGSGKSFIAELAVAQALCRGWVLYLAPTNALVYQIRRDLQYSFSPFESISTIRAFVGGEEYTILSEEQITVVDTNYGVVMTPEKCAVALRLFPERFANCSLCVFDECHLLNEPERGVTSDVLIARLSFVAPNIRFLLMSAMVSNPGELAEWLTSIRGGASVPITVNWRPSRTMRALLFVDEESLDANFEQAKNTLEQLPERRVNQPFTADLALIAGLSGPWTMEGPPDYRVTRLPISFPARASRRLPGPQLDSWKNTASRLLARQFATSRIPTICFVLTSRHHAFSSAEEITESMPGAIEHDTPFPPLVEAWLSIAEYELGADSALRDLLHRGISVHTSALLPTEQAASEWMFLHKKAILMFATPTLAQGLNLPAEAVVIGGTSMGDPRDWRMNRISGISRINALILNAFGRAGRPGFSNQGIAVLITDSPYLAPVTTALDPRKALQKYQVLGEADAALEVHSPVEAFLDTLISDDSIIDRATRTELILTSLLAEYESDSYNSSHILSGTLAAYHKRQDLTRQVMDRIRTRITSLKEEFLQQPNVPSWINGAAMKAGVDFFRAWKMWSAYEARGLVPYKESVNLNVVDWLGVFSQVMTLLPPRQIRQYLPANITETETVTMRMLSCVSAQLDINSVPWQMPHEWPILWRELFDIVLQYMRGASYSEIAQTYLGLSPEQVTKNRGGKDPIPVVLRFVRDTADMLSIDAGCFLAIHELGVQGDRADASIPETLQALSLCIRNGCDSLGTLAWYRFGYHERVCAHALQRTFKVPEELTNDGDRADWVRKTRREWLSGKLDTGDQPILALARTIIQGSAIKL